MPIENRYSPGLTFPGTNVSACAPIAAPSIVSIAPHHTGSYVYLRMEKRRSNSTQGSDSAEMVFITILMAYARSTGSKSSPRLRLCRRVHELEEFVFAVGSRERRGRDGPVEKPAERLPTLAHVEAS